MPPSDPPPTAALRHAPRWLGLALAWTGFVLLFGTDLFSRKYTLPIIWWFLSLFGAEGFAFRPTPLASNEEGWLRKSAHLFEYAVLAWAWWRAFRAGTTWPRWRAVAMAWLLAIGIAILDELQQGFVWWHRTGNPRDVLLDAAGAALPLLLVLAWNSPGRNGINPASR